MNTNTLASLLTGVCLPPVLVLLPASPGRLSSHRRPSWSGGLSLRAAPRRTFEAFCSPSGSTPPGSACKQVSLLEMIAKFAEEILEGTKDLTASEGSEELATSLREDLAKLAKCAREGRLDILDVATEFCQANLDTLNSYGRLWNFGDSRSGDELLRRSFWSVESCRQRLGFFGLKETQLPQDPKERKLTLAVLHIMDITRTVIRVYRGVYYGKEHGEPGTADGSFDTDTDTVNDGAGEPEEANPKPGDEA